MDGSHRGAQRQGRTAMAEPNTAAGKGGINGPPDWPISDTCTGVFRFPSQRQRKENSKQQPSQQVRPTRVYNDLCPWPSMLLCPVRTAPYTAQAGASPAPHPPWPRKTPLPTDAAGPACRAARALVGSPPIGRQRLPNRGCATARRTRLPPLPHRSPAWSAEAPSAAPLRGAQTPPAPLPIRIASPTTNVPAAPRSAAPPPGLALLPPSRRSCAIPPSPPPSTFPSSRFVWFPLPFYIGPSSSRQ